MLAIGVVWTLPEYLATTAYTEIWYAKRNDFQAAQKLASLPTPQNSYTLTSVGTTNCFYFWLRLVDENGNSGEYTAAVLGQSDSDPTPIISHIQGAITASELNKSLINKLKSDNEAVEARAKAAAFADTANKIAADV